MNVHAVRYYTGERYVSALMKVGHKNMHCVVIEDSGVKVVSEPKEAARWCEPLTRRGAPYPIDRFVRHLKRVGRERGITEAAREIIAECSNG